MKPILIGLSPNTEPDDVALARRLISGVQDWGDESILARIETTLAERFSKKHAILTTSGRQALYFSLKASGIHEGDEVIVQAFNCIAVPEAVLWTGATPVYADIDRVTFNLDLDDVAKKITAKTKAIIIQHTFGISAPLQQLRELTAGKNIKIIEDSAHSLTAGHSDTTVLSFGRDKMLSSVFGGALLTDDDEVASKVRGRIAKLSYPPDRWVIQQLRHPIIFEAAKRDYFTMGLGKVYIRLGQRFGLLGKAVLPEEKRGLKPNFIDWRYSPALAQLLASQLEKLDRYTARRAEITKRYNAVFKKTVSSTLRYPLLVKNRAELLQAAKQKQIMLGDWYDAPLVPKDADMKAFQYVAGSCPISEEASKHIINLPTYPTLSDTEVNRVIDVVKSYV